MKRTQRIVIVLAAIGVISPAVLAEKLLFASSGLPYRWVEGERTWGTGDLCATGPGDCSGTSGNPDWAAEFQTVAQRWNDATDDFSVSIDTNSHTTDCMGPENTWFAAAQCSQAFGGSTLAVSQWRLGLGFQSPPARRTDSYRNYITFNTAFTWDAFDGPLQGGTHDFRRVGVHELGHSLGLDHTDDNASIMWFQESSTLGPQGDDLAGIAAYYRDNRRTFFTAVDSTQVIVQGAGPSGASDDFVALLRRLNNGQFHAEIRRASNGSLVKTIAFLGASFEPVQMIRIPDQNGNGADELVVLAINKDTKAIVAQVRDIATGNKITNLNFLGPLYHPVSMTYVPDADNAGNGEVGLLAFRIFNPGGGTFLVQMRDAVTDAFVGNVNFLGTIYKPLDVLALDDADNNGVPDLAVLAIKPTDGRWLTQIKNATGAPNTRSNFYLGPAYEPLAMQVVPDADNNGVEEIGVLARRTADGAFLVQRRNASGSRDPHNAFFLNNQYSPRTFAVLDADANGTPDYAVLARRFSNSSIVVQFRNAAGAAVPRTLAFLDSTHTPTAIQQVADRDGNGVPDIAVLGHKGSNGRMRANIKNVSGAAASQNIFFSGN